MPKIALDRLLRHPAAPSVIAGPRNEALLRQSLGAVGWSLTP